MPPQLKPLPGMVFMTLILRVTCNRNCATLVSRQNQWKPEIFYSLVNELLFIKPQPPSAQFPLDEAKCVQALNGHFQTNRRKIYRVISCGMIFPIVAPVRKKRNFFA